MDAVKKQTRLNVNVNDQTAGALKGYAERNGVSVTEALRRLVGVADSVMKAVDTGHDVLYRKGGETDRVVFTW